VRQLQQMLFQQGQLGITPFHKTKTKLSALSLYHNTTTITEIQRQEMSVLLGSGTHGCNRRCM